jgi:hypothetical protein
MGGHRARLDRRRRSAGRARRRGGLGLHLADSALPHRQLADDEPERAHEHAGLRRRPLSQDRPLRDGAADRHGQDQYLHRAGGGAAKFRGNLGSDYSRPSCSRASARAAASPTSRRSPTCSGPRWRRKSQVGFRHERVFSPHHARHAWHYGIHLVQSFVSNAPAARSRRCCALSERSRKHASYTVAAPSRTRRRGNRVAEHRRLGRAEHRAPARALEPGRRRGALGARRGAGTRLAHPAWPSPSCRRGAVRSSRGSCRSRSRSSSPRMSISCVSRSAGVCPAAARPSPWSRAAPCRAGSRSSRRPASSPSRSMPTSRWCRRIPDTPCSGSKARASPCAAPACCRSRSSSRRSPRPWWSPA